MQSNLDMFDLILGKQPHVSFSLRSLTFVRMNFVSLGLLLRNTCTQPLTLVIFVPGCYVHFFSLLNVYLQLSFSNLESRKVSKRLRPSQLIGTDVVPSFAIKGRTDILVPVYKRVLHLTLSPRYCLTSWMQAPVIPCVF
jgi:hypothetical protein